MSTHRASAVAISDAELVLSRPVYVRAYVQLKDVMDCCCSTRTGSFSPKFRIRRCSTGVFIRCVRQPDTRTTTRAGPRKQKDDAVHRMYEYMHVCRVRIPMSLEQSLKP